MRVADGEVVWSWSPDAGINPWDSSGSAFWSTRRKPGGTVANKPGSPGRARISR